MKSFINMVIIATEKIQVSYIAISLNHQSYISRHLSQNGSHCVFCFPREQNAMTFGWAKLFPPQLVNLQFLSRSCSPGQCLI